MNCLLRITGEDLIPLPIPALIPSRAMYRLAHSSALPPIVNESSGSKGTGEGRQSQSVGSVSLRLGNYITDVPSRCGDGDLYHKL